MVTWHVGNLFWDLFRARQRTQKSPIQGFQKESVTHTCSLICFEECFRIPRRILFTKYLSNGHLVESNLWNAQRDKCFMNQQQHRVSTGTWQHIFTHWFSSIYIIVKYLCTNFIHFLLFSYTGCMPGLWLHMDYVKNFYTCHGPWVHFFVWFSRAFDVYSSNNCLYYRRPYVGVLDAC